LKSKSFEVNLKRLSLIEEVQKKESRLNLIKLFSSEIFQHFCFMI